MTQAVQSLLLSLMLALGILGQPSAAAAAFASSYPTGYEVEHSIRGGASGERYAGEQYDPDLGLYYLRARYYSTQLGRFWNMDTYEGQNERPDTLHKYLYCKDDPINLVDPSGNLFVGGLGGGLMGSIGRGMSTVGVAAARSAMQRQLGRAVVRHSLKLPGHVLARGRTFYAWLLGALGAGVSSVMKEEATILQTMEVIQEECPLEHCVEFAVKTAQFLQHSGKREGVDWKIIVYNDYRATAGRDIPIYTGGLNFNGAGRYPAGTVVGNGIHAGIMVKVNGQWTVSDNNVLMVKRYDWTTGYFVENNFGAFGPTRIPIRSAHNSGIGRIWEAGLDWIKGNLL